MNLFHYLKYSLIHVVGIVALVVLLLGGPWISMGLLALLIFYIGGDAISGDDTSTPTFKYPYFLTFMLWLALPLLCLIVFVLVWRVSPGDVGGIGAYLQGIVGYDFVASKETTHWLHLVSGVILTGLMIGVLGTVTAHELTHRTWDPVSLSIGRWLLAFSFDTSFSIEHVYGHHRYVATTDDPATAPRGRNVYWHILYSTVKGNVSAWEIEKRRLTHKGKATMSLHNRFLRGNAMSLILVVAAYNAGGMTAVLYFIVCGLWGKALLEIVNYMEHYGIVRERNQPVQPRHSWNTTKRMSSWGLFNLCRHSHHHAQGDVPFQDLKPFQESPTMVSGYLTTIVIAMIPPLWHRLMTPKVREWDKKYASDGEKILVQEANKRTRLFQS